MSRHQEALDRAVEVVERLLAADQATEQEGDVLVNELRSLVPDPNVSDLIYWPQHHPLGDELEARGADDARVIVELAFRYEPFAL